MSQPNPFDNPELFDSYVLGGVRSPGVVTFSGHDRDVGWETKKAVGKDGAKLTRKGHHPVKFTASHHLVVDKTTGIDQITEWKSFRSVIKSTVEKSTPKALDIYHPDLARNRIFSVVLDKTGGMVHDGKGGATIVITYLEYKPPKVKKAIGPTGGSGTAKNPLNPVSGDIEKNNLTEEARLEGATGVPLDELLLAVTA